MPQVSFDEGRCVIRRNPPWATACSFPGGRTYLSSHLATVGREIDWPCHRAYGIVVSLRLCNVRKARRSMRGLFAVSWKRPLLGLSPLSSPSRSISGIVK